MRQKIRVGIFKKEGKFDILFLKVEISSLLFKKKLLHISILADK